MKMVRGVALAAPAKIRFGPLRAAPIWSMVK
jgi:hypothetical protein